MTRFDATFAGLVVTQTAHSIEEYYGRLWEVFSPAAAVTSLVSADRRLGFVIINAGLLAFGASFGQCDTAGRRLASLQGFGL